VGVGDLLGELGGALTHERDHAAVTGSLAGLVHQATAQRDQIQAVALGQAPGGDQRGQLPQRVTRHEIALRPAERDPSGEARAEDRRLGEVGPVLGAQKGILAHDVDRQGQQLGRDLSHEVSHLGRLAALAREQDRGPGAHASVPTLPPMYRYSPTIYFPPIGGTASTSHEIGGTASLV
jgi:hypothetical protein